MLFVPCMGDITGDAGIREFRTQDSFYMVRISQYVGICDLNNLVGIVRHGGVSVLPSTRMRAI